MTLEKYLKAYLDSEANLRQLYGDLAYYSKPVVYQRDEDLVPVAPWAEYAGEPLILPHPDYVEYMAITAIVSPSETVTLVRYQRDVIKLLATLYSVEEVELPIPHVTVQMPAEPDSNEYLHRLVEALPEVQV